MFLLDTNVVSEIRRPERADANVRAWAHGTPAELYAISVMTVLELERGILRIERRDVAQGGILRRWLEHEVLMPLAARILPIDTAIARRCAALHVPDPRPERDALIAATALVHGLTLVTRNVADFASTGVELLNPWLVQSGQASGLHEAQRPYRTIASRRKRTGKP
jgi:predicted nucleic acid-binding protein